MNDLMEYSKRMVGAVRERLGNRPAVKDDGYMDGGEYMNGEQFATCVRAYYPDLQIASVVKDGREYRHATVIHGSQFPHSFTVRLDCGTGKVSTYAHGLRMPVSLVPGIGTKSNDVDDIGEKGLCATLGKLKADGWKGAVPVREL
jgi:hypothetical protein